MFAGFFVAINTIRKFQNVNKQKNRDLEELGILMGILSL